MKISSESLWTPLITPTAQWLMVALPFSSCFRPPVATSSQGGDGNEPAKVISVASSDAFTPRLVEGDLSEVFRFRRRVEAKGHRNSALAFGSTSSAEINSTSPASICAARLLASSSHRRSSSSAESWSRLSRRSRTSRARSSAGSFRASRSRASISLVPVPRDRGYSCTPTIIPELAPMISAVLVLCSEAHTPPAS